MLLSSLSSFINSSSFFRSPLTQWKRPVDHRRAPEIHTLRLVPGVLRRFCSPRRIQQKPTLGLSSNLVSSWKNDHSRSNISAIASSLFRFSIGSLGGGTGRGLLQRNPRRCNTRRTVSWLTTSALCLKISKASSLQLQRERSQPHSVGGLSSVSSSMSSWAESSTNDTGPRRLRSS